MATTKISLIEQAKRAGCWAVGFFAIAIFFALGILISLLNTDFLTALQAIILTAIFAAAAVWIARKKD